ncbi:hypothetical protein HPB51_004961 [Rhipicephalus microplus]|uniref:Uncharacterized protein n=1 Tax=Rhipicephalus microplus TaxID=6941 RepID=A0A9J6EXU1_RHIMP|nr:uncharacterized protein LOC119163386 [Rhipicephalus microplus]KAH8039036.1 hypothetical protein HPB51_004961 [Rhipicephalus microplus]
MDLFFPQRLARYDLRTSESFDCQEAFGYGPFQKRLFILLILSAFSLISQTSILTIVFGDVDHWCRRPRGSNISATEWKNIAIPLEADGRLSHCRIYERCLPLVDLNFPNGMDSVMHAQLDQLYNECLNAANDTRDVPCEEWDYDDSVADSTAVSTWNMVCHQRLIKTTIVALQYAGAVIIVLTSGMYADSLSRKSCLVASASALVATTVCSVLANTYHVYALARFLAGGLTAVSEIFSIVIPFEVTTHAHRPQQVILWHLRLQPCSSLCRSPHLNHLVTGIALVTVMKTWFTMIAVFDCLLSAATGAGLATIRNILNVMSRGVSVSMLIHILMFVMELFPSAVRSSTLCWVFASGRVGAVFASTIFVLQHEGREDVAFAVAALLLFVSLLVMRVLPRATMVEQAKEANTGSCSASNTIKHLRRTLERPTNQKTKSGSTDVRKNIQTLANNATVSSKASTSSSESGKSRKGLAMDPSIKSSTRRHGRKSRQKLGLPKSVPMSGTQAVADIG